MGINFYSNNSYNYNQESGRIKPKLFGTLFCKKKPKPVEPKPEGPKPVEPNPNDTIRTTFCLRCC